MTKKKGCKPGEIKIDGKCFKKDQVSRVIDIVLEKFGYHSLPGGYLDFRWDLENNVEVNGFFNEKLKDVFVINNFFKPTKEQLYDIEDMEEEANTQLDECKIVPAEEYIKKNAGHLTAEQEAKILNDETMKKSNAKTIQKTKIDDTIDVHDILTKSGQFKQIATKPGKEPNLTFEDAEYKLRRAAEASKNYSRYPL